MNNTNESTVLDLLREIIEEAQKHENWPNEEMSLLERSMTRGTQINLDFPRYKIDELFSGVRELAENNTLIHTYDCAYDLSGKHLFTTTDPNPNLGPIVSRNYYGSCILYPWSCDPGTIDGFANNGSNLSLFYSKPVDSDSTECEELNIYLDANRFNITSKKEEGMSDITVYITGGSYLPFNHLANFYVKEKGGSIKDF